MVDVCIYKLSTNLQNFIQKDLTEVRYYKKFELGYFFSETPSILPGGKHTLAYGHYRSILKSQ